MTPLEQENANLKKELKTSREAYSLLGQDKEKKLKTDLKAKDVEITNLGFKVGELERLRASDKTLLLAEFKESPEFVQIIAEHIFAHMDSLEVQQKIAKYWDDGFEAFRHAAQTTFLDQDFPIIQPGEDDSSTATQTP
ncbi:hypothetical protein U1Q18_052529 [Sarracenia purpurea var. burkii]